MKKYDAAIAGGGLIGGAIALELAGAGLKVALFDRQKPGAEASWAGAGILSPAPESASMFPLVPIGKASLAQYPEYVAALQESTGQNVGFRPNGTIEALFSRDAREQLSTIIALHHGLGLRAEALSIDDARELEPALSEEAAAAVLRPDEAAVDNRKLTAAILEAARRAGVEIFPDKPVKEIRNERGRCVGFGLQSENIDALWTIIAAGCFSSQIEGVGQYAPVQPARGQMIALRSPALNIERVLWSDKVYLVPRNDGNILAGATVEYVGYEKKLTAAGIEKILAGAIELAPDLADAEIVETWCGLRPDSPDHLPILGQTDLDGLLIATGHFRSGILLTPITARLICEWITKQSVSVDWDRFSPMRFQNAASGSSRSMGA
jgi:glycine oxidase